MYSVFKHNFLLHGTLRDKQGSTFGDDDDDDGEECFDFDESQIVGWLGRVAVRTVYTYKKWRCGSANDWAAIRCRVRRNVSEAWYLVVVRVAQWYLWLQDTTLWKMITLHTRSHTDRDRALKYTQRVLSKTNNFQGNFAVQM
jgi:hypothetical protein